MTTKERLFWARVAWLRFWWTLHLHWWRFRAWLASRQAPPGDGPYR